ncbi:hypothetical protein [Hoeflea poritis]|uniref:DUF4169 domain-containing protein n=1 Tax=Hoeflea poritis TaxID=2993659 RepID=A0ABT4VRX6_9HYPH|nr:hypothetical protein [Hoeflea poritis]MDA4847461.1 hypothetical protein [Hoeflea poritis]
MGQSDDSVTRKSPADARKERLAAELRANLQRRKGQSRARRKGAMDEAAGLPASEGEKRP